VLQLLRACWLAGPAGVNAQAGLVLSAEYATVVQLLAAAADVRSSRGSSRGGRSKCSRALEAVTVAAGIAWGAAMPAGDCLLQQQVTGSSSSRQLPSSIFASPQGLQLVAEALKRVRATGTGDYGPGSTAHALLCCLEDLVCCRGLPLMVQEEGRTAWGAVVEELALLTGQAGHGSWTCGRVLRICWAVAAYVEQQVWSTACLPACLHQSLGPLLCCVHCLARS
jgi:hypothetical protein